MIRLLFVIVIFLFSFTLYSADISSTQDGDWNATATWAGGSIPTSSDNVTISHAVTVTGAQAASTLTIDASKTLTITKDGSLTVTGAITDNGTLTINSDADESGALIAKAASSVTITYNYYVDSDYWRLISPVMSGEVYGDIDDNLAQNSAQRGIGTFDNGAADGFVPYTTSTSTSTSLTNGTGYEIMRSSDGTIAFTGTMLNAQVQVVVNDGAGANNGNWNLIGNPFPSYYNVNSNAGSGADFLSDNVADFDGSFAAVYAWDGIEDSYDIYNQSSDAKTMQPGDGFFVYCCSSSTFKILEFEEDAQTVASGGKGFSGDEPSGAAKNIDFQNVKFILKIINEDKRSRKTEIYFNNKSTRGLDPGYDAGVMGMSGKDFQIYSHLVEDHNGINMGIQSLPYSDMNDIVVPIGINAKAGEIALVVQENTIPYDVQVYLEDKNTGKFTAFDEESNSIKIQSSQDLSGTGRFFLHFNQEKIDESNIPSEIKIYAPLGERKVIVEGLKRFEEDPTFTLYNVKGELVKQRILNKENGTETIMVDDLSGSVYIVNLNFNSIFIKKKIIIE